MCRDDADVDNIDVDGDDSDDESDNLWSDDDYAAWGDDVDEC